MNKNLISLYFSDPSMPYSKLLLHLQTAEPIADGPANRDTALGEENLR